MNKVKKDVFKILFTSKNPLNARDYFIKFKELGMYKEIDLHEGNDFNLDFDPEEYQKEIQKYEDWDKVIYYYNTDSKNNIISYFYYMFKDYSLIKDVIYSITKNWDFC